MKYVLLLFILYIQDPKKLRTSILNRIKLENISEFDNFRIFKNYTIIKNKI